MMLRFYIDRFWSSGQSDQSTRLRINKYTYLLVIQNQFADGIE